MGIKTTPKDNFTEQKGLTIKLVEIALDRLVRTYI